MRGSGAVRYCAGREIVSAKPSPKGVLCKHRAGFALVIPWHIASLAECRRPLILGRIRVVGDAHKHLRLAGEVPASWLVDLNAAPVEVEVVK